MATGKIVNRAELADILGVSLPTINAWVKQKMPFVRQGGRGVDWQFDTASVIQWRADQAAKAAGGDLLDIEAVELEIARVKLEQEKIKFARAAELIVPLDQLERRLSVVFAEIRTAMRNIPGRTVSMLIGESDERRFKSVLLDEIDRSLTGLAEFNTAMLDESLDASQSVEPE